MDDVLDFRHRAEAQRVELEVQGALLENIGEEPRFHKAGGLARWRRVSRELARRMRELGFRPMLFHSTTINSAKFTVSTYRLWLNSLVRSRVLRAMRPPPGDAPGEDPVSSQNITVRPGGRKGCVYDAITIGDFFDEGRSIEKP